MVPEGAVAAPEVSLNTVIAKYLEVRSILGVNQDDLDDIFELINNAKRCKFDEMSQVDLEVFYVRLREITHMATRVESWQKSMLEKIAVAIHTLPLDDALTVSTVSSSSSEL